MGPVEKNSKKVGVFIDLPNYLVSLKQNRYEQHEALYRPLEFGKQYGEVYEAYAFGDFQKIGFFIQQTLLLQNIRLIQCPGNPNGGGEGKIDDPLLIEGIHDSLRKNSIDVYVIVSSDIVILPVSATLRFLNKTFKILGFSQCASSSLKRLPEFIDLNQFLKKSEGENDVVRKISD